MPILYTSSCSDIAILFLALLLTGVVCRSQEAEEAAAAEAASLAVPASTADAVAEALRRAPFLQEEEGRGGSYYLASLLVPHLRTLLRTPTTLLVPTDAAIFGAALQQQQTALQPSAIIPSLARFHTLTANLSFADLLLLPDGALLPSRLGDRFRHRITSSNTATAFLIDDARVVQPDMCPPPITQRLTCHGIDRVLTPTLSTGPILQTRATTGIDAPPPATSARHGSGATSCIHTTHAVTPLSSPSAPVHVPDDLLLRALSPTSAVSSAAGLRSQQLPVSAHLHWFLLPLAWTLVVTTDIVG